MTILVTGATGNTGRHVVTELLKRGRKVRALTRDLDRARELLPDEVELIAGTHTDPGALGAALDGVSGVHITVTSGTAETGPDFVRRAVAAGVTRLTILWGGYVGPAEEAVAASGVAWTRLEAQEFMSNALAWRDSVRDEGIVREPFPDVPSAVVHEGDIGSVAAAALTEEGHSGQAYNLTGPEPLTLLERIAILGAAIGRDIGHEELDHEQAIARLTAKGVPLADAEYVIGWHANPPVEARTVGPTVERVLGRPARTFAEWAEEHAGAFR